MIDDIPDCFGQAISVHRECKACALLEDCMKQEIKDRPPCFGIEFYEGASECMLCIYHDACEIKKRGMVY